MTRSVCKSKELKGPGGERKTVLGDGERQWGKKLYYGGTGFEETLKILKWGWVNSSIILHVYGAFHLRLFKCFTTIPQ